MKNKRIFIAVLLVLVLAIVTTVFVACNDDENDIIDIKKLSAFEYTINGEEVIITGLKNINTTEIIIPDGVTQIAPYAFRYNDQITSITIPDSLKSIGELAFGFSINSVHITNLSNWCNINFDGLCSNPLQSGQLYLNGELVTDLILPDNLTSINDYAFDGCASLTSVTIPDNITDIGDYAFLNCPNIENLILPSFAIKYFRSDKIKSVTVTSGDKLDDGAFFYYPELETVTILSNIPCIPRQAFEGCSKLIHITIPDSVKLIDFRAFYDCTALSNLNIPEDVTEIASDAFLGTPWYNNLPQGLIYIGKVAYKYRGDMPENTSIKIKEGTVRIEDWAFESCHGLKSITLPNSVTSIGDYAFYNCSKLSDINIPDKVTTIGNWAFSSCLNLTNIVIPANTLNIGFAPFSGRGLTSITVSAENPKYHSSGNCLIDTDNKALIVGCRNSIIPTDGSVTSIEPYAFDSCHKLTDIIIPNTVTSIGYSAFFGCNGLTNIIIPDSISIINDSVFRHCSGLTNITIPSSVTIIHSQAFDSCDSLTDITFKGTKSEWNVIEKRTRWCFSWEEYVIHCTDGDLDKNGNEI